MNDDTAKTIQEQNDREQRLHELLAVSPVHILTGVVGPNGAIGFQLQGQTDWTLIIPLVAWRFEGENARQTDLTLRQRVSEDQFESLRQKILPYNVGRVRARVALENELGTPHGLLEAILDPDPETADLKQIVTELRKRVAVNAPPFGELVLDRSVNWFTGKAQWNHTSIEVQFSPDASGSIDKPLAIARAIWSDQFRWEERAKDKAIEDYLETKNSHWLEDGQSPLTADDVRSLLKTESITFNQDGTFEFWCDESDIFGGHSISIACDLARGPFQATLEG